MTHPPSMSRDQIFGEVQKTLVELFSLDPAKITTESGVFTELELDSIDAVDLVAKLQELIGQRITEAEMRQVRTVGDMVTLVERYLMVSSPSA